MKVGDTFIWYPPNDGKEHLWIAVTDPNQNGGKFAAFNLTRSRGGPMALTFRIGEHPFITRYDSDVAIGDSLVFDISKVQEDIRRGTVVPHQPMPKSMIEKIAKKAVGHPAIPEDVEILVKSSWGL